MTEEINNGNETQLNPDHMVNQPELITPNSREAEAQRAEQVKKEADRVLKVLIAKNTEFMKQDHPRLGWHLGTGEGELFILDTSDEEKVDYYHEGREKMILGKFIDILFTLKME